MHPSPQTIAVDVDGTLLVNGQLNAALVEFLKKQKANGTELMLWSSRGRVYAKAVAERFEVAALFDVFASKPRVIVDDHGWDWTRFTQVIRVGGAR